MTEEINEVKKGKGGCLLKIFLVFVAVVVIGLSVLIYNIGSLISSSVELVGTKVLKAPVKLEKVSVSPFTGKGKITGFVVGNPEGYKSDYAFSLNKVAISFDVASLNTNKIHIYSILIERPSFIYEGNLNSSNIVQLQKNIQEFVAGDKSSNAVAKNDKQSKKVDKPENVESQPVQEASSKSIQIDSFIISDATMALDMGSVGVGRQELVLPPIKLKDIGKGEPKTPAQAIELIIKGLQKAMIPVIQKNISNIAKNFAGNVKVNGKNISELEKDIKNIKDIDAKNVNDLEKEAKKGLKTLNTLFGK